jgi:hypothetical protein
MRERMIGDRTNDAAPSVEEKQRARDRRRASG